MAQKMITYWSDKVQRGEPLITKFSFKITAAKTVFDQTKNAVMTFWDALASQAVVDTFLGTTSEFVYTLFGSTAMGTDAFGGIIDFGGEVKELVKVNVKLRSGTNFGTLVENESYPVSAILDALEMQCALGANGNVGFHSVLTGVDILTSGSIEVTVYWYSK